MSYRPSSRPPKGAWSRHLHEQRRARDLSQTQAFELVYERVGWSAKSRTAYVAIDMGERQPKEHEAAVLGEEFGWPSEEEVAAAPPADLSSIVAAIDRLTAAVERGREERVAWEVELVKALGQLLRGETPSGDLVDGPREGALQ